MQEDIKKILLIDDDLSLLELLELRLSKRGFTVMKVSNADQALNAAVSFQPDLILLDINLNHRSGWDVFREFSEARLLNKTRVMVLSGLYGARPEFPAEFEGLVAGFLSKPFRFEALLTEINHQIRSQDPDERPA